MSKVYVGTSGWQYRDWQGGFYPKKVPVSDWLEYYSKHFNTVEVNATFYHQMKPSTFAGWAVKVPTTFVFSVKANRFITHIKRLLDCDEPLKRLLEQVKELGNNLGPNLFQLPPRWKVNTQRLSTFCKPLPKEKLFAFEFRDESWFQSKIFNILKNYNVAAVINDSPHFPKTEEITTNFTYIRLHGPSALYSSEYSKTELKTWAAKIQKWLKSCITVFAYFNNDVGGFAVKNARTLISMLEKT